MLNVWYILLALRPRSHRISPETARNSQCRWYVNLNTSAAPLLTTDKSHHIALLASTSTSSKRLNIALLVVSSIITVVSLRYIRKGINAQKLYVIRERKARLGVV